MPFSGFTTDALTFLRTVHRKNSQVWYQTNKQRYESLLLDPLRQLVTDLAPVMLAVDDLIEVAPWVNKTISRLHRDLRFSPGKSRFRDTAWITFKRPSSHWRDYPTFFFELGAGHYRYGMGFYAAAPATMDALRARICEQQQAFRAATRFLQRQDVCTVEGTPYRRRLQLDLPPDLQGFAQRKNLYLACNCEPDDALFSPRLVATIQTAYQQLAPLYRFMQQAAHSAAARQRAGRSSARGR